MAVNPPLKIKKEWAKISSNRPTSEWALQWVWNQTEVSVALSGMNAMSQVKENINSASHSAPGIFSPQEMALMSKAQKLYLKYGYIGCTGCRYCSHCPSGVDIPVILDYLNQYSTKRRMSEQQPQIKEKFNQTVLLNKRASNCIRCGQCEAICPQHLPIRKLLAEAASCLE